MAAILEMLEQNRFIITIGFGGITILGLIIYFIVTSMKSSAKKSKKSGQSRRKGSGQKTRDGKEEFLNVDSNGLPLDDDDDGEYRDSNLYGKQKKDDKEEYYKDWD